MKNYFVTGPITPQKIAESIAKHQSKHTIGGHNIFLGQVRADEIKGQKVTAIEYSCYTEMANKEINKIKEAAFKEYELTCAHIYHSSGIVKAGEISLFVFTSSPHRAACFEACRFIVEEIKKKVPIFGKELFENQTYQWKENKI